jgi:hypothetical protein
VDLFILAKFKKRCSFLITISRGTLVEKPRSRKWLATLSRERAQIVDFGEILSLARGNFE